MRIEPPPVFSLQRSPAAPFLAAALVAAAGLGLSADPGDGDALRRGERIYRQRCSSCHGESGEGVQGGYSRPLAGDKSLKQLSEFIDKSMPEDAPETCVGQDAEDVARFVYEAFYSPIAQARHRAARIEPSRLTVRQYRNAVADLAGSFRASCRPSTERGLRGEYFNAGRPGRQSVLERVDPQVRFDFGRSNPAPDKLGPEGFSVRWEGALEAPDTGEYEFLIRTDHAARLWINDPAAPLIDAWVKSGSGTEHRASLYLLGGRAYPLKLEFSSRRQGVQDKKKEAVKPVEASIELAWRPPRLVEETIPSRRLSPERAPEVLVVKTPFPPDDRSSGYERGTAISRAWEEATTAAAIETAGHVAAHLGELAGVQEAGADREAKLRQFTKRLVERAFRRPLSGEEERLYVDRQFDGASDLARAVKRTVMLALQSPRFLYHQLGGDGEAGAAGFLTASRLSFALWDSLPDQELLEAAAAGRLASRADVARHAERMLHDPRARSKARQFLYGWLQIEHLPDLTKDEKRFPGFGEALASDLRTSLDVFLEDVVWGEGSDFRQLLLSPDLYLNGRTARFYGFELPADAPFQKVRAASAQRAGVLSHPYLMARFAYPDGGSPIHRGVFILRSLLGRVLRPPPEAFAPLSPDLHPELTTRERVALQTEPKACHSCHGMINPLGFTLERFDAVGRYRDEERGRPIDASGSYELPSGETKVFNGPRDLAEFLAGSEEVHRAFVSQLFHHLMKQPILGYGKEAPEALRRAFAAGGFSIRKLMVEIATMAALAGPGEGHGGRSPLVSPRPGGYNQAAVTSERRRSF